MSFAWQDATTGHKKVVIRIEWQDYEKAYYLDAGAYDHEKEVLLDHRYYLYVRSVEEV